MPDTTYVKDAQFANRETVKRVAVDSAKPIISLTHKNTLSPHNSSQSKATDSESTTFRNRKTYVLNTSYRGNLVVQPKDSKPTFYSTAGGYFYKKQNGNREVMGEKNELHINRGVTKHP